MAIPSAWTASDNADICCADRNSIGVLLATAFTIMMQKIDLGIDALNRRSERHRRGRVVLERLDEARPRRHHGVHLLIDDEGQDAGLRGGIQRHVGLRAAGRSGELGEDLDRILCVLLCGIARLRSAAGLARLDFRPLGLLDVSFLHPSLLNRRGRLNVVGDLAGLIAVFFCAS